ncbi:hypothetical protein [Streptomyces sp. NPDC048142]|uniref:hypothetical protein n=1 Tax=Streptomyces sp. NPDC048142 TaxID=3365501 RepID=UPI0037193020
MSDAEQIHETSDPDSEIVADPAEAIRSEVVREYGGKLAKAEFRAQAAIEGVPLSSEFIDLLDFSKLVGEDGNPSAEAIKTALQPFQGLREPDFPQLAAVGHHRVGSSAKATSLDARHRV